MVITKTTESASVLTSYSIGGASFSADHTYDGPGRLWRRLRRVNFNRLIKTDATVGVTTTNYEHVHDGSRHLGTIDVTNPGTPVNGKVWKWGLPAAAGTGGGPLGGRMPGPPALPPQMPGGGGPGGVEPPVGATYFLCNERQEKNIEWAIAKMCAAVPIARH